MAFTKFINFGSAFVSAIFNEAHGAMWAINGRLSGFYPAAVGGDTGTPGIVTSGTTRIITVNLNAPATADDLRFPPAGQTTSFCLANGVLLKSDAITVLSLTITDASPLTDPIPLMIYAQYDDSASAPTFAAARENVIDAAPTNKAKLAFYDPIAQTWQPTPQLSVGGIFQTSVDITSKYGGLLTTRLDSGTLKVTPGTIIGSFGRISSSGIRLVPSLAFPESGKFRKDLLVIEDPQSTTNELTQPLFTILRGLREDANVINTEPVPPLLDPKQVPLAEIMMSNSGIGEVIDIRPIMAWQTDSMMQSAPLALRKIDINTVQPGFIATDTTQGQDLGWGLVVFRGLNAATGGVLTTGVKSSMAIGIVGPGQVKDGIIGPAGVPPLPFVPNQTVDFPPKPWILEDSFQVIKNSNQRDVTHDPLYAINFDFKNGIFVTPGITAQSSLESFKVNFRQLQTIFVIGDDGVVHVPGIDAFYRHIRVDNPAAHKATNITYDNSLVPVPNQSSPTILVQTALEELSAEIQSPTAAAVHLESWRLFQRAIPIWTVGPGAQAFNFIGPSGVATPYVAEPAAPVDTTDDGIIFFPGAGQITGVSMSLIATSPTAAGLSTSWTFSLWIGDGKAATFAVVPSQSDSGGTRTHILKTSFDIIGFVPPAAAQIASGQFMRLGLATPTNVAAGATSITLTLSLDFIIRLA